MDNAAEQYDLITVLSRLDRSKGKKGEIGQGYSMDERGAATDARRMVVCESYLHRSNACWRRNAIRRVSIIRCLQGGLHPHHFNA
jgi:hypothetical protein